LVTDTNAIAFFTVLLDGCAARATGFSGGFFHFTPKSPS